MAIEIKDGKLIMACPECGKTNAVAADKITKGPACGACQAKLPPPADPVELNDANFQDFISRSALPVLVDFWAPWCGPCRMMTPILENLAKQRAGQFIIGKLNTDDSPNTPGGFGIQGIPTLILFRDGREARRQVGAVPQPVLEQLLA